MRADQESVIDLMNEVTALKARAEQAQAERDRLRERVAAIADDFHPDRKEDAALALQEMRDALNAALEAAR